MTLTPKISTLIDPVGSKRIVRDQIAAILLVESKNQQALALAESKDERLWALRVFTGRTNPWEEFSDDPDQADATPIVNVSFVRGNVDAGASNTVERQKIGASYWIDCYGYGVSGDSIAGGHLSGDASAEDEAMRAMEYVRQILMASHYTYLDLRGSVWRRMPESFEVFELPTDARVARHVKGARLTLSVDFNEFSPQYVAEILNTIQVDVCRSGTGELYFGALYGDS